MEHLTEDQIARLADELDRVARLGVHSIGYVSTN